MRVPHRMVVTVAAMAAAASALAPIRQAFPASTAQVVHITARRFQFSPSVIHLKRSLPVVLEFTTLDRKHGFKSSLLGLHTAISPGQTSRIRLVPNTAGTFTFHCDVFCGSGHEEMEGTIVIE